MSGLDILGWAGSALLVFSVLQTRVLRLRLFNGLASVALLIFNAAIQVWPMVALNLALTAINAFYIVRMLRTRHDANHFEIVEISPDEAYLRHLIASFDADIQRFNPGFTDDDVRGSEFGFLILQGTETVGVVLARNAGNRTAQVQLDYVVPRFQDFTVGEFVFRPDGPFAERGFRRIVASQRMRNASPYLTRLGFRTTDSGQILELE